jgi:endonuclease-8
MPEGDTIHLVRAALAPHLLGVPLVALHLDRQGVPDARHLVVTACEAVGKHLLLTLARGPRSDDADGPTTPWGVVRVHLGMKGAWHSYRHGEPWQRHPDRARVILATAARVFVCFDPREVARLRPTALPPRARLRQVGPDLLSPETDLASVVHAARDPSHARTAVADLLLTQAVASGLGNVYKSELLFMAGVDPWAPVEALPTPTLTTLYGLGATLLGVNTARGGWRVTTDAQSAGAVGGPRGEVLRSVRPALAMGTRHWVYRRAGRPCFVCSTRIQSRIQGPMARMTYWCMRCQAG